jgi:DNA invertase Pin-like site-specific DNA recombinase
MVRRARQADAAGLAAQYLRMSNEHQRYSVENQAAAIADYARRHGLQIVKTYVDRGVSGLHLRKRKALQDLLGDVVGGAAGFDSVLVYDVSRWGRFQNPDQSASYEFLCREAGVAVEYCAETFVNDGSPGSIIVKNLKRVMAAEFSRELSAKVTAGKRRLASKGYWQNGSPGLGLRRQLVDGDGRLGPILEAGQRKAIQGCHVTLAPGPPEEIALVNRIYRLFTEAPMSRRGIARRLNGEGLTTPRGNPWSVKAVTAILADAKYVGDLVYNRMSVPMRGQPMRHPRGEWRYVREAWPGVVERDLFDRAQAVLRTGRAVISRDALLVALRTVLETRGELSWKVIGEAPELPSPETIRQRIGPLRDVYAALGRTPPHHPGLGNRYSSEDLLLKLVDLLRAEGRLSATLVRASRDVPAYATYQKRFGSVRAAIDQARRLGAAGSE